MNRVRHTCFVYVHTSALKKKKAKNSKRIAKEWKWCERKFKWLLMTSPAGSIDLTCLFNNFVHVCSLFYLVVNLVVKLFFKTYTVHKLMMIMITCLNVWIIFFWIFPCLICHLNIFCCVPSPALILIRTVSRKLNTHTPSTHAFFFFILISQGLQGTRMSGKRKEKIEIKENVYKKEKKNMLKGKEKKN